MDLRIKYVERDWYKILPQTPSRGVDYSLLMVESTVDVLVKEERRPGAITAAVPPPIFLQRRPKFVPIWNFVHFSLKIYLCTSKMYLNRKKERSLPDWAELGWLIRRPLQGGSELLPQWVGHSSPHSCPFEFSSSFFPNPQLIIEGPKWNTTLLFHPLCTCSHN
jgi:hypothetical protein